MQGGYKEFHLQYPRSCIAADPSPDIYRSMLAMGWERDLSHCERILKAAKQKPWKNYAAIDQLRKLVEKALPSLLEGTSQ